MIKNLSLRPTCIEVILSFIHFWFNTWFRCFFNNRLGSFSDFHSFWCNYFLNSYYFLLCRFLSYFFNDLFGYFLCFFCHDYYLFLGCWFIQFQYLSIGTYQRWINL